MIISYAEMKTAAAAYQQGKALLYQQMEGNSYGAWLKKPAEVEVFNK